jgi:Mn-containing catalase
MQCRPSTEEIDMFYTDGKLQYPVRVDSPNPLYAKMLQQAIGGVEGEIRVSMQYFFQAWGARGPKKYRDMLLNTATEEIAHIEMLSTAVALNLEASKPAVEKGVGAKNPAIQAMLGGQDPRHYLSSGGAAMPVNSNGVPFDMSHIYASGNLAADMYANVAAEATGRALACRLYELTDDPGMKDMWSFLIARDTMHQQQWLAVLEELGGPAALPIPNSFPQAQENSEFSYTYVATGVDGQQPPEGRWSQGPSIDGRGEFSLRHAQPLGEEPLLSSPAADTYAQTQQIEGGPGKSPQTGNSERPEQMGGGMMDKIKERIGGE